MQALLETLRHGSSFVALGLGLLTITFSISAHATFEPTATHRRTCPHCGRFAFPPCGCA